MSDQAKVFLNIRGKEKKKWPLFPPLRNLHNPFLKICDGLWTAVSGIKPVQLEYSLNVNKQVGNLIISLDKKVSKYWE